MSDERFDPTLKMDQFLSNASEDQVLELNELLNSKHANRTVTDLENEHKQSLIDMNMKAQEVYNAYGFRDKGSNWKRKLDKAAKEAADTGDTTSFMNIINL